jgi:hypothetical protein
VTGRHSVAARALILREIRIGFFRFGASHKENVIRSRNLPNQQLVSNMLRMHPFRVHKDAAPLKHKLLDSRPRQ